MDGNIHVPKSPSTEDPRWMGMGIITGNGDWGGRRMVAGESEGRKLTEVVRVLCVIFQIFVQFSKSYFSKGLPYFF